MPQHFVPSPTYPRLHEILMEYIARTARGAAAKPKIAYVYADTEFGRDGIPGGKARAEKLGLPIVAEIVTKQSGVDVTHRGGAAAPRQARHRHLPGLHPRADARVRAADARGRA